MQKHLNLSPLRQQSKPYDDSASTCSSHGSKKRGRLKVKGRNTPSKVKSHNKSSVQEHHTINSAPPSTERQGHTKVKGHHHVSVDQQSSVDSATSSKTLPKTSSATYQISLHGTAPVSRCQLSSGTSSGCDGPTKCASSYRVRLDDYQQPVEVDKKVALCEAVCICAFICMLTGNYLFVKSVQRDSQD